MRQLIATLIILFAFMLQGCEREEKTAVAPADASHVHGTPKDWKFALPQGNAADGRRLFIEAECHKCHEVKGETYPAVVKEKGDVGPELSQMARLHPPEYLAESLVNPNAVIDHDAKEKGYVGDDGKSKMPDYNDTFTVRQLADLTAYLASLKGSGHKAH
jgi:mono/diheme cytochrome c family protein